MMGPRDTRLRAATDEPRASLAARVIPFNAAQQMPPVVAFWDITDARPGVLSRQRIAPCTQSAAVSRLR
jgi:hypothetical protein